MRISIFGLGYVGAVSSACLADLGHEVVGVDVNPQKVDLINAGQSPIVEEGISDLIGRVVAAGRLRATTDEVAAVAATDVSFISVGTPSAANGLPSLSALDAVVAAIGDAIRVKRAGHVVVVRSTVLPGTTDGRVAPLLIERSGRRLGDGLDLCFNPEFLREGSSIRDFYRPPFSLVGCAGAPGHAVLEEIYRGVDAPMLQTSVPVAESVKYLCNIWHATKVSFANEAGALLKSVGVDSREVMEIFCQDRSLNLSRAYLRPGYAFGGSCLPKDLRAFLALARQQDVDLPFLSKVLPSNERHIERACQMVMRHRRGRVALFGLAFKPGTDDLRESPLVALAERLIGKGFDLSIFDRHAEAARLMGANRDFIDREIPHFERLMAPDPASALADAEIIVVGHASAQDRAAIAAGYRGQPLIDLQGSPDLRDLAGPNYEGICW
jgi:GDP-mannose 6-dehydrogenase